MSGLNKTNNKTEYAKMDRQTRSDVIRRDKGRCVMCGEKYDHIHEILPKSRFGRSEMRSCYEVKNRISLCMQCHTIAHTKDQRKKMIEILGSLHNYDYKNDKNYRRYL